MTKRLVEKGRHNSKAMIKGIILKPIFDDNSVPIQEFGIRMKQTEATTEPSIIYSV